MARLRDLLIAVFRKVGWRGLSTLVAIVFSTTLLIPSLTGLYTWLSPFLMLNSVLALKSLVWLNGAGCVILIISFFRKRWFCRYLCPTGLGCDLVSAKAGKRGIPVQKIPKIGRWLAFISLGSALMGFPLLIWLDPMSIFNGFFAVFSDNISIPTLLSLSGLPLLLMLHWFFPNLWCTKLCPLGGLQDELYELKNIPSILKPGRQDKAKTQAEGRRLFLASGIGILSGVILPGWVKAAPAKWLRPPGSAPYGLFNLLCTRCGSCIKACPSQILIHHKGKEDILAWMTPEISFENQGYCQANCNLCSRVCPGGAITLFTIEAKTQLSIGLAEIRNPENCLLARRTECDRCKAACPYHAIEISPSPVTGLLRPVVDKTRCTGCGACAAICPPVIIRIILAEK